MSKKLFTTIVILVLSLIVVPSSKADNIDDYKLKIDIQQTQDITHIQKTSQVRGSQTNEITYGDGLRQMYKRFMENSKRFMQALRSRQKQQLQNFKGLSQMSQDNAKMMAQNNKIRQQGLAAQQKSMMQNAKQRNDDLIRKMKAASRH